MEDRSTWLRAARRKQGMTQEKLAAMASVAIRTVQRAEAGRKISVEVWKDFEAVLGGGPVLARRRDIEGKYSGFALKTFKPLRRLQTAKDLLDRMTYALAAKLDYDVEPTPEILPALRRAVEFIEARLPDPWNRDTRRYKPATVLQRLEDETALNEVLEGLHGIGASIFYETYVEKILYPQESYEGYLYVENGQKGEYGSLLHVVISASEKDRETFPEVMNWGVDIVETDPTLDEDVPF